MSTAYARQNLPRRPANRVEQVHQQQLLAGLRGLPRPPPHRLLRLVLQHLVLLFHGTAARLPAPSRTTFPAISTLRVPHV